MLLDLCVWLHLLPCPDMSDIAVSETDKKASNDKKRPMETFPMPIKKKVKSVTEMVNDAQAALLKTLEKNDNEEENAKTRIEVFLLDTLIKNHRTMSEKINNMNARLDHMEKLIDLEGDEEVDEEEDEDNEDEPEIIKLVKE